MEKQKKLDKKATIQNILNCAKSQIRDKKAFNELMTHEDDILLSAELWGAEIIYK